MQRFSALAPGLLARAAQGLRLPGMATVTAAWGECPSLLLAGGAALAARPLTSGAGGLLGGAHGAWTGALTSLRSLQRSGASLLSGAACAAAAQPAAAVQLGGVRHASRLRPPFVGGKMKPFS